tara:strand:- start:249 stop:1232 length:984 start_codon:yes stop_codon:yes gene_type:complete
MSEQASMVDADGNYQVENPMEALPVDEPTIDQEANTEEGGGHPLFEDFDENLRRDNKSAEDKEASDPLITDIEPVVEGAVEPRDDESRFQYWQSKHDQKASEAKAMESRLKELEDVVPIANYIRENPEALQSIAGHLSGNTQSVPAQAESKGLPQKPERPVKPASFDASEAYMDPESESAKYQQKLENYRDSMIDYYEEKDAYRQEQEMAQQQAYQQQQEEMRKRNYYNGVQSDLVNKHGYTPEKAQAFMQYYSSPDSLSLDNLVMLDKMKNAPSKEQIALKQRQDEMNRSNNRVNVPPPAGIASGEAPPQMSEEDLFSQALLQNKR